MKRYMAEYKLPELEYGEWVKHSDAEAAIAAAVKAERQRCARIADLYVPFSQACVTVAAAIRSEK